MTNTVGASSLTRDGRVVKYPNVALFTCMEGPRGLIPKVWLVYYKDKCGWNWRSQAHTVKDSVHPIQLGKHSESFRSSVGTGSARVQSFRSCVGIGRARDPGFLFSSWKDGDPYEIVCCVAVA
jgi:hypothetical protein